MQINIYLSGQCVGSPWMFQWSSAGMLLSSACLPFETWLLVNRKRIENFIIIICQESCIILKPLLVYFSFLCGLGWCLTVFSPSTFLWAVGLVQGRKRKWCTGSSFRQEGKAETSSLLGKDKIRMLPLSRRQGREKTIDVSIKSYPQQIQRNTANLHAFVFSFCLTPIVRAMSLMPWAIMRCEEI